MAVILKALIYTICFFASFSLYPEALNRPSENEIYLWGSIMFVISLGTLLLLVFILSKFQEKKFPTMGYNLQDMPESKAETDHREKSFLNSVKTWLKSDKPIMEKKTLKEEKLSSVEESESIFDTDSLYSPISDEDYNLKTSAKSEAFDLGHSDVFSTGNSEFDDTCSEFLHLMSASIPCRMVILFIKEETLSSYMELKGALIQKTNGKGSIGISEDMMEHLEKKQGAYSGEHTEAVLPILYNSQLFGAVMFCFDSPVEQIDIARVWPDIKKYSGKLYETKNITHTEEREPSLYNLEDFYQDLNQRFQEAHPQNLTLIKILKSKQVTGTFSVLTASLPEYVGNGYKAYRISVDTIGLFLDIEGRDKFSKSLRKILPKMKKDLGEVEICVGAADFHSGMKGAQKWYERALNTLNEAIAVGPNNYRLYKVD